jgi:hypothetical protein
LPFQIGHEILRQTLRAQIVAALAGLSDFTAAAGDAGKDVCFLLQLREDLFDRAARYELNQNEIDQHDAEQRWQDQGQSAQDVGAHRGKGLLDRNQKARDQKAPAAFSLS